MWVLGIVALSFVGSHLALSHVGRPPLVRRLGERGFTLLYSAVASVTLAALVLAYRAAPAQAPLWPAGAGLWAAASALTLIASVLLTGSLVGNPAFPGTTAAPGPARGVFAITRHPMMWAFALWAVCHAAVYPVPANLVLTGAISMLALVGAAGQDRKKRSRDPRGWSAWEARTSFVPFAATATGRARLGNPGAHALGGGLVVWLAASWAHIPIAGWRAGIWRWVG